jgi:hypothetical protein
MCKQVLTSTINHENVSSNVLHFAYEGKGLLNSILFYSIQFPPYLLSALTLLLYHIICTVGSINSVNASGTGGGSGGYYPPDDLSHSEILEEGGRGNILPALAFLFYY